MSSDPTVPCWCICVAVNYVKRVDRVTSSLRSNV